MKLIAILILALATVSCSDPAEEGRKDAKRYLDERAKKEKEQEKLQMQVIQLLHEIEGLKDQEYEAQCYLEAARTPGVAQSRTFAYLDAKKAREAADLKFAELTKNKNLDKGFLHDVEDFKKKYVLVARNSRVLKDSRSSLTKSDYQHYRSIFEKASACKAWKDIQAENLFPPDIQ